MNPNKKIWHCHKLEVALLRIWEENLKRNSPRAKIITNTSSRIIKTNSISFQYFKDWVDFCLQESFHCGNFLQHNFHIKISIITSDYRIQLFNFGWRIISTNSSSVSALSPLVSKWLEPVLGRQDRAVPERYWTSWTRWQRRRRNWNIKHKVCKISTNEEIGFQK